MEPAKSRETTTMAAKLPSRALPRSLEATKRSIVPLSTRLLQREYPSLWAGCHLGGIGLDMMAASPIRTSSGT